MSDQVLFTLLITFQILGVIIMIRNEWVFRMRMWMIHADLKQYLTMPSHSEMIFRIWVWSARGFGWRNS